MYLSVLLIAFVVLTMFMAMAYFYFFARRQERFIQYWGFCWVFYSCSLLFLILSINYDNLLLLEARKVFDVLNILCLLFGAYAFIHRRIPGYWYRFTLYMIIWAALAVIYNFTLMALYIPVSMYQAVITVVLCVIILRYWDIPKTEKALAVPIFFLWGFGKALLSLFEVEYFNISTLYLIEIIFSNVLNFFIFIIYLQKATEDLQLAERRFRIIAENASDVIFFYTLRPQPAFSYVSPSAEILTGYTPQEYYNDPKLYLKLVEPEYFPVLTDVFGAGGNTEDVTLFRLLHKNGAPLWAELRRTVIYENGQAVATEGIIRDVTLMKNAEEELTASKNARELLLSYISHELKTPITTILGYVTALRDGTLRDPAEKKDALDIIARKALVLERLIQDLFQLSKLETKQFSFRFMMVQAQELVSELISRHSGDVKSAGLHLKTELGRELQGNISIIADPDRIDQVFSNILFNAIRFSRPGERILVKAGLDKAKENLLISITDKGAGIAPEDLPHVFDRFYKAERRLGITDESNSGLGLTISKEIIEAHNGNISVRSRLGKGSMFIIAIPVYKE
ncbi:MAG: PAS domain-containing sensor histidine kinase [Bacillota bacterium]|nr:PAS domain-containing sensor histidine kinase [Bacillota bacterium]